MSKLALYYRSELALFASIVLFFYLLQPPDFGTRCGAIQSVSSMAILFFPNLGLMLFASSASFPVALSLLSQVKKGRSWRLTLLRAALTAYFILVAIALFMMIGIGIFSSHAIVLFTAISVGYSTLPVPLLASIWYIVIVLVTGISLLLPFFAVFARVLHWQSYRVAGTLLAVLYGCYVMLYSLGGNTEAYLSALPKNMVYTDPCRQTETP